MAVILASGRDPQAQQHRGKGDRGRAVFYSIVFFGACWLQLTVNISVYFAKHRLDFNARHAGPFALHGFHTRDATGNNAPVSTNVNVGHHESRSTNSSQQTTTSIESLQAQLSELRSRFETIEDGLHEKIETDEGSDPFRYFFHESSSSSNKQQRQFFVPFTIRDAQRTVPTQIPYGFNVFDFIDLYAAHGDQNQTKGGFPRAVRPPAELFHNGHRVPDEDRTKSSSSSSHNDDECLDYSKECYRSKFLKVLGYLLNHRHRIDNKNFEYYYFYMESDNDLCVPLSEIRELAFLHRRYFISAGTGASGWIMSSRFVREFYDLWKDTTMNSNPVTKHLSEKQKLEPDAIAAALLKKNRQWSVTRRYLTSHSILIGNTEDAASISNLYEREIVEEEGNNKTAPADNDSLAKLGPMVKEKLKAKQEAKNNATNTVLTPARYLPRCLEPHRGVWPNKNETTASNNNNSNKNKDQPFDMLHWEFFDYDLCPESDIFPCKEGQLEALAKKDPYYLRGMKE